MTEPRFQFIELVEVAPRRDLDTVIEGRLVVAMVVDGSEPVVEVSVPEGTLPFNENVRITLFGETREAVLWLPPAAFRTFDGVQYVLVEEDAGRRRIDVETGLRSEDRIEVVGDLAVGDAVMVP